MREFTLEERIKRRFDEIAAEKMQGINAFPCCVGCKFVADYPDKNCCKVYLQEKPNEADDDDYVCPHYQK